MHQLHSSHLSIWAFSSPPPPPPKTPNQNQKGVGDTGQAPSLARFVSIKRVLDTLWNGHLSAIVAILSNYAEIADALQKIGSNQLNQFDGETVVTAVGLAAVVVTRDFLFICVMMKRVLELLKPADESLHQRSNAPDRDVHGPST